jgi:hypothetical protein
MSFMILYSMTFGVLLLAAVASMRRSLVVVPKTGAGRARAH